jgi:phosphatidylserine decarboxylase
VRVVREGAVLALVLVGVGGALGRLASWPWAVPWLLLAGGILYFFRDPDREIPNEPHLVLAPADGMVSDVECLSTDGEFGARFSIFLRMRDVHVIRSPVGGRVASITRTRGRFMDAEHPRSHLLNEQNRIRVEDGRSAIEFVQIAGMYARRIVCWVAVGDEVQRGQRVGLIRFGSRADVYLPPDAVVLVKEGAHVRAGLDAIARLATPSNY